MNTSKKIFDIIPPSKEEKPFSQKAFVKQVKEKTANPPFFVEPKKGSFLKRFFLLGFLALVVLVSLAHFVLAKAEIQLWPKTENIIFIGKITVSVAKLAQDGEDNIIPGRIFEQEESIEQEFAASGLILKEDKAQGTIKVYNTFSTASQILVAGTRFMSSEGKLFRSQERVVIPGGILDSKGKLQPGTLDVKVVSDQPGESFNIGATTFSIPGFVGTAKYTAFYGKSSEPMSGGFSGQTNQVTKGDLDGALDVLTDDLILQGNEDLKQKIPDEYQLSFRNESMIIETLLSSSSLAAGTASKNFKYSLKIRIKALVFKETDLKEMTKKMILAQISEGKKFHDESLVLEPTVDSLDVSLGTEVLNVKAAGKVYSEIDEISLKTALQGKSLSEARTVLSAQEGIERAQISVWPFWLGNIPENNERIETALLLD